MTHTADGKAIGMVLALAALVRLAGIASRPIWYDEAFAILFSAKGPEAMLYGTLTTIGAGAILEAWRSEGFSHLLCFKLGSDNHRAESRRFTSEDWKEMDILLSKLPIVENYNIACIHYSLEGN